MELNDKTKQILQKIPRRQGPVEQGILPLVNALNALQGITTVSSCEGHHHQYPYVLLAVDGSAQSMESMCFLAHALKSYHWRALASPLGSAGDLSLRFVVLPAMALKDAEPDQPAFATRALDPANVAIAQKLRGYCLSFS